jgi:hypothetical protein
MQSAPGRSLATLAILTAAACGALTGFVSSRPVVPGAHLYDNGTRAMRQSVAGESCGCENGAADLRRIWPIDGPPTRGGPFRPPFPGSAPYTAIAGCERVPRARLRSGLPAAKHRFPGWRAASRGRQSRVRVFPTLRAAGRTRGAAAQPRGLLKGALRASPPTARSSVSSSTVCSRNAQRSSSASSMVRGLALLRNLPSVSSSATMDSMRSRSP